ncbi:hypothetical protein PN462_12410 [Spirulina sp. CS-785/01]|uniref:hypothetical protein n=1 Tax=Spirulina sp. CS-785/01 TaxID=3021716 RepID=UPI00232ECEFB|nr:hypothetical protein [Spirulina sp. CS-785/01]MDB9313907.1 hypothetical protein [Spirulina sp. CS-785/01]
MTQIPLVHLKPALLEKLQKLAETNNRNLEEEIEAILETTLENTETTDSTQNLAQAWAKIDAARQQHFSQSFSNSADLLREDRQR